MQKVQTLPKVPTPMSLSELNEQSRSLSSDPLVMIGSPRHVEDPLLKELLNLMADIQESEADSTNDVFQYSPKDFSSPFQVSNKSLISKHNRYAVLK